MSPYNEIDRIIRLNVTAVTRLACAVIPRFLAGSNISHHQYRIRCRFDPRNPFRHLRCHEGLRAELFADFADAARSQRPIRPSRSAERGGDVGSLRVVMAVEELVDAALIGFDRCELVTLPSLPSHEQWEAFQSARVALSRPRAGACGRTI